MKVFALFIKQGGIACAKNLFTLFTFLVLNAIFIIPIAQFVIETFGVTLK
jgi:hypothetical protein